MIHCRIPGKDLRNLLMRFLNILCKYICKGMDLHNYFKMTQLISLWVQTDIRPFISFISMTACKLCLVLWMDPLPQSLPLNIPQFWSRFLLTGSGLESTASITLLHTVSRITVVVNIYWVLTILVRLEPLSPFYKWTQEPPPKITCSRSHSIGRGYKWKLLILTVPWYASGSEDGYHSHVKLSISTTI